MWVTTGCRQWEVVYKARCYTDANIKEISNFSFIRQNREQYDVLVSRHKIFENAKNITLKTSLYDIPCLCTDQPKAKKILNISSNQSEVIVHSKCPRNLFTSMLRHLQTPSKEMLDKIDPLIIYYYHKFCDNIFRDEIIPLLQNFSYDVESWLNHLKDYDHQLEVIPFYKEYLNGVRTKPEWYKNNYTLFTKQEKQIYKNGKIPKCRAISACPAHIKWIMGPIILVLEHIFQKHFKGYKINDGQQTYKTNEEIETFYENAYQKGFDTIQDIDGSRWDTTQYHHMKHMINLIYNWLADNDKIHHVDKELFRTVSTQQYRSLIAKYYHNGKTHVLLKASVDSTTFSGSPDTTFANTLTNATIGRYIFEDRDMLNLNKNEYIIFTSGDDYASMTTKNNADNFMKIARKVWEWLGLVPKYIKIGPYSDLTFCSTNVIPYKDELGCQKFKIVRQVDRMDPLSHWSIKALRYSQSELKHYYNSLAQGIRHWAHDMPYYSYYAQAYEQIANSMNVEPCDPKIGRDKIYFKTSNKTNFDSADYEGNKELWRVSNRKPPEQYVKQFLLDKYHYGELELLEIQQKLSTYFNYLPSAVENP